MSAYRRVTRFLATAAAGASILAGGIAYHVHSAAADVERVPGVVFHDPAIRQVPEAIAEIPGTLSDINEVTDGPVREAVIATACDALAQGNTNPDWESGILSHLLNGTQPPEEQLLGDVQNLTATLTGDLRDGATTQQEIGTACQVYLVKDNLS